MHIEALLAGRAQQRRGRGRTKHFDLRTLLRRYGKEYGFVRRYERRGACYDG